MEIEYLLENIYKLLKDCNDVELLQVIYGLLNVPS